MQTIDYDKLKAELKAEIVEELARKDYRAANDTSKQMSGWQFDTARFTDKAPCP